MAAPRVGSFAELSTHAGVAVITLNRPDALNAMSPEMLTCIEAALDDVEHDGSVRCVVIKGTGRAFSAGGDVADMLALSDEDGARHIRRSHDLRDRIEALDVPTIAAVHGYALGGGLELAISCDIVVCAASARLGLPEARVGLLPSSGGCSRLPLLVGVQQAKYLVMTGRRISAAEALRCGLVTLVVPDDELDAAWTALADDIRAGSPVAIAAAKRTINAGRGAAFADAQALEHDAAVRNFATPERREGLEAQLHRRPPRWAVPPAAPA
jgi:enoyl-CoA hydratase